MCPMFVLQFVASQQRDVVVCMGDVNLLKDALRQYVDSGALRCQVSTKIVQSILHLLLLSCPAAIPRGPDIKVAQPIVFTV